MEVTATLDAGLGEAHHCQLGTTRSRNDIDRGAFQYCILRSYLCLKLPISVRLDDVLSLSTSAPHDGNNTLDAAGSCLG